MIDPTPIHVPDDVLTDLRARLALTRWPEDAGNQDWYYGVNRAYLQELVEYWRTGYDWRRAEAAINAYEHYLVDVDGVPVHFMRRPGVGPEGGPAPTPLILTHGWPWTFWQPAIEAPTGITFVGYENPPGVGTGQRVRHFLGTDRAAWYNHVNLTAHDRGGHFIPWEAPDEWIDDLRRTFRGRR
ncbi:epoxide hydrolase [Planomonospora sphaerica]|uniref:Epoxide hydrolase n=1 Tax=Planomonospora sphaerica TaxID=161355 RepID=A0A171CV45_9ACTN|nr:epoxide hydrolase N-terminal domain-containing protein [Planomonospora sphaerica]GAT67269.1 epoxide hydrolase [Planomonospora sphaerica]